MFRTFSFAFLAAISLSSAAQTASPAHLGLQHRLRLNQSDINALAAMQHKSAPTPRTAIRGGIKPCTGEKPESPVRRAALSASAGRPARAYTAADTVFFDSFEDWDGRAWAYINSSNWTRYSNCSDYISEANGYCPAWMAYQTDGTVAPFPSHGNTVAMTMNGYNVWNADSTAIVTPAPVQDEWIVSRLIPSKVSAANYLSFDIAYMPYTFYYVETFENGRHDAYIDRDSLTFDVEVLISQNMRTPSNRPENYTTVWRASEQVAPLFQDLHSGDDISADPELMGFHWHHVQIPLADFEGSNIRVAFRYKGQNGGTVLLDNVRMSDLLPAALYDIPAGTFYYGMSVDGYYETTSPGALLPAGVKTLWPNYSSPDGRTYQWLSWHDGDDREATPANSRLTTEQDLTAEPNKWGSYMPYPTLTVSAPNGRTDSYTRSGFVSFGGGTELTADGTTRTYGATSCDLTKQYWTASSGSNYAFGAPSEAIWAGTLTAEGEKLTGRVCGIANVCEQPAAPYKFSRVWVPLAAFSTMTNTVAFQCDIYRATPQADGTYGMSSDLLATSTCTAKDIKDNYRKTKLYSLLFDFADSVGVGEPIFIYIHGFEGKNILALAPYAQAQGHDSGKNFAYIALQKEAGGSSLQPLSRLLRNADGQSHAASSFLINIDAKFPAAALMRGDIDGDGRISVSDVTELIAAYLDGAFTDMGDLDNDRSISVADITALINLYLDGQ